MFYDTGIKKSSPDKSDELLYFLIKKFWSYTDLSVPTIRRDGIGTLRFIFMNT